MKITSKNNNLSERKIQYLRLRLQKCEERIIETAKWDDNYFYDGSLPSERYDKMIELLRRRRKLLNWMCVYTENEIRRIEELDTILTNFMRQMYTDLNNLHAERIAMTDLEPYNYSTWLEARLSYHYDGMHTVLKMVEDAYYGSRFDNMLNLLNDEEANLSYRSDFRAYRALTSQKPVVMKKKKHDLCPALLGLLNHPIYSVPDVLRMNSFKVKMVMEQERILPGEKCVICLY